MLLWMTNNMSNLASIKILPAKGIALALLFIGCLVPLTAEIVVAQVNSPAASVQLSSTQETPQPQAVASGTPAITFADALQRATMNDPQMQTAFTAAGLAHEDLVQRRAAMLPNVTYNMSAIYTQPTPGTTVAERLFSVGV